MFVVCNIKHKLVASGAKCSKHSDLKKHFSLRLIPTTSAWRSVDELFFVFLVPVFIHFFAFICDAKGTVAGLEFFTESDAAVLGFDLFGSALGPVDYGLAAVVDKRGAACEAGGEDVHFEVALDDVRGHAGFHCDVRADDVVAAFVLSFDFNNGFVPNCGEEFEEA